MSRVQVGAFVAIALLATLVIYLAVGARQPPQLPADEEHARFRSPAACLTCHGPAGVVPQSENHTVRTDCMACHGRP